MNFYKNYYPITATPFLNNEAYTEVPPCDALKPFIRCFWGTKKPIRQDNIFAQSIVTPDTCVDIIFQVNFTENKIEGSFCGIDDHTLICTKKHDANHLTSTFAIRFYAWSAIFFAEDSLKNTKNQFFDARFHFQKIKKEIEPKLFDITSIEQQIALTETYLLRNIQFQRENSIFNRAIQTILQQNGNLKALELAKELHISSRQMERIFQEYAGIPPKKMLSLIRYQSLWQDILYNPAFNIQDAAYKFGYTDQAHLLNDFRSFHGMPLKEAKKYALEHL